MNKYYSTTRRQHIVSIDTNQNLARFDDTIFDYSTGDILAIMVSQISLLNFQKMVILPRDIMKWTDNIYVQNKNDISDPEDIVRLKTIYEDFFSLIRLPVFTESEQKIGKVRDYMICDTLGKLKQIIVGKHNIPTRQIVSINADKIVVKDLSITVGETVPQTSFVPEPSY